MGGGGGGGGGRYQDTVLVIDHGLYNGQRRYITGYIEK